MKKPWEKTTELFWNTFKKVFAESFLRKKVRKETKKVSFYDIFEKL